MFLCISPAKKENKNVQSLVHCSLKVERSFRCSLEIQVITFEKDMSMLFAEDLGVYVCVCVFIKLHITAQSGPVILVILCHSH